MAERISPDGPTPGVLWVALTIGVLVVAGILVADALDTPRWADVFVIFACALLTPPLARRLELWTRRR